MMKKRITFFAGIFSLLCSPGLSFGQIPNAGFENWTGDTLTGWWSNNVAPLYATISKTTTAHGGTYAVRGVVVSLYTQTIQPALQSGVAGRGFSFTQRPTTFTGYYEFSPAGTSGDRFAANVVLYKGGTVGTQVGVAAVALSTAVSSYTQFTATFNYLTSDTPDTCVIQFQIVGPGTGAQASPTVGSYFLLDDIAFTGVSGVADQRLSAPTVFQLDQNYPNPFNPATNISFTVPSDGKAKLTVLNLLGQEVGNLFEGSVSSGRTYKSIFNASDLPSGVYFSRLDFQSSGSSASSMKLMRKMTLIK